MKSTMKNLTMFATSLCTNLLCFQHTFLCYSKLCQFLRLYLFSLLDSFVPVSDSLTLIDLLLFKLTEVGILLAFVYKSLI